MGQNRKSLRDWIFLHNPAYLISAVCMLVSCVMLANDSESADVTLPEALSLVGTLALYQMTMFVIGAYLVLRRDVLRDGRTLLILDAVFLADITFAHTTLIMTHLMTGMGVGLMLAALAAARVNWIAGRLGSRMPLQRYLMVLGQLFLLVAIPVWLKHVDNGKCITERTFYAWWWILGLATFGGVVVDRAMQRGAVDCESAKPAASWVQPTYLVVPWLSLILHLSLLHYVYKTTFTMAMVSPILLAAAMVVKHIEDRGIVGHHVGRSLQILMLVLALAMGVSGGDSLTLQVGPAAISAARMTLAGAYLAVVVMYFARYAVWCLMAACMVVLGNAFGPTSQQTLEAIAATVRWIVRLLGRMLPSSKAGWAVAGIIASFALLGIGTLISLRKPADGEPQPASEPEPCPDPSVLEI